MAYIGLHEQIQRNNRRSFLLLIGFPLLILMGIYAFFFFMYEGEFSTVNYEFITVIPFVIIAVLVWFMIAWASHSSLINMSTGARPLERKENMRVYNLTENLCMSVGMNMPKLYVIDSPVLNAYASGIGERSYAVTLTTGIIETLDDRELEGVIAHELTHIRNKDVRLLIISIIFVGILGFVVQVLFRTMLHGSGRRKDSKIDGRLMLVALLIAVVVYILTILFRFALSRKREYLADAGAVEMTKNPLAMANALRKISGNHDLDTKSSDVKQMFIANYAKSNTMSLGGMFATHPPIEKRITFLEQM